MARERLDAPAKVWVDIDENGDPISITYNWRDRIDDGDGTMTIERQDHYLFADLPPGAATSFVAFLGNVTSERDANPNDGV